jgi:glycosyltransferase involved in cell wall biosynthesis
VSRPRALWISWERHRRSRELARALDVPLAEVVSDGPRLWRSLSCAARTVGVLLRHRPKVLFVQNPSVQLAYLTGLLKPLLDYTLVVDRHSNFDFENTERGFFNYLSNDSIRRADLTIVTNDTIADLVEGKGGRALVLQDLLPTLRPGPRALPEATASIVYICSFLPDEPVEALLGAARRLGDGYRIYVTGKVSKQNRDRVRSAPPNVTFTGFLAEEDYASLLGAADLVVVLTTRVNTLLCGAYEGVSLGKPLILSNQVVLREYFTQGVVLTENTPESIEAAIRTAALERDRLAAEMANLIPALRADWATRFDRLQKRLGWIDGA